jgi:predicted transposase YdaD
MPLRLRALHASISMTKPYDQAFKYLAEDDPTGLLLMLGAIRPGQEVLIQPLAREVSVSAQLPDQPYQIRSGGVTWIIHVEAQTVYDSNLPDRMMEYAVRLWLKHRLPINSYALVLTNKRPPKEPGGPVSLSAGHLNITLSYQQVCLWEISAETALGLNRDSLIPFVPLMQGGVAELEAGVRRLASVPEKSRSELSLHFLLLGGLRYNPEKILGLIGRATMIPLEQLKESSFYQYILQEGREEGREEGRLEGRLEGLASVLLLQIQHRFGTPSSELVKKINAADDDSLKAWAVRLLTAGSLEDVFDM